jgi:hypothetical protein
VIRLARKQLGGNALVRLLFTKVLSAILFVNDIVRLGCFGAIDRYFSMNIKDHSIDIKYGIDPITYPNPVTLEFNLDTPNIHICCPNFTRFPGSPWISVPQGIARGPFTALSCRKALRSAGLGGAEQDL